MKNETYLSVVIAVVLLFLSAHQTFGQHERWSPPDKIFTIDVPIALKEVDAGLSDSGNNDPDGYEKIRVFAGIQSGYIFKVLILDRRTKTTKPDETSLGGLEFVLGGDDDHSFTNRSLKIEGLPSREIVYTKQNTKGLMIDAGYQIYVLGLSTENRKDLNSGVGKRFFKSFRLLKNKN